MKKWWKMTEKRFEFQNQDHHLNIVFDNQKGGVIFNEDIVDVLNHLNDENEQLKSELKNLRKLVNEMYMEGSE